MTNGLNVTSGTVRTEWPPTNPCGMASPPGSTYNGDSQGCFIPTYNGKRADPACYNGGHGTAVASIIAGNTYGVARKATIVPITVADCSGDATTETVVAGFDAVYMAHGGDFPGVVNASFGLDLGSDEVDCFWPTDPQAIDAVTLAIESLISDKSIATVASANNGYAGHAVDARCTSPAGVSEVITVGGFDSSGAHLDETMTLVVSNGGPGVDVHAPGSNIASASIVSFSARRPDLLSGTSFSAAHVTGCVARYLQHWPWETPFGVHSSIVGFSTTGLLTGLPPNTPNRALFCPTTW